MKLVFSDDVADDFQRIGQWVGQSYHERGEKFTSLLRERCRLLLQLPSGFPVVRIVRSLEVRKFVVKRHLIFYAVRGDEVTILRIVHGATDWSTLFDALEDGGGGTEQ